MINNSQLRWQCRRGMLELDLILLNFFDQKFSQLDDVTQNLFAELLTHSDQELYTWLVKKEPAPEHLAVIINSL
jgi:antitoxin CptB